MPRIQSIVSCHLQRNSSPINSHILIERVAAINKLGIESDEYREWRYVPACSDKDEAQWKPQQVFLQSVISVAE